MYEEAIARGVVYLDAEYPGWSDRIDWSNLDMMDCRYCVLGQASEKKYWLTPAISREWAVEHGFDPGRDSDLSYETLAAEWLRIIWQRPSKLINA